MTQNYYTSPSSIYAPQRFGQDKFPQVETITSRPKPRESQPPMNINEKMVNQVPKYPKEKEANYSNPYTAPPGLSSTSYRPGESTDIKVNSSAVKNYVNPYSQYPQSSIQPRFPKTIPYEEELTKRAPSENTLISNYNQVKNLKHEQQPNKTMNIYQKLTSATTPTQAQQLAKRVPRFSQPPLLNQSDDLKFDVMPPSPFKAGHYNHSMSVSDSGSAVTPPPKGNVSDHGKYTPLPSKQSSINYTVPSTSSTSSTSSHARQYKLAKRPNQLKITDFARGMDLGSGKFGQVYLAKHKQTGFICAIKEISKSIIIEENIMNQFIRQLKIQSCLEHPNIIKLYGFFHDKKNIYLILELGSQGQLYKIIKEKKKLSEATVSFIIRQLCEAVTYLHSLNVIHRDIKPQNIVIQYGTVKICDFGWSVCRSGQLRSTFCGTPLYVSPEILKGELYDQKIDIWALGILTYELLVGDTPFQIYSQEELVKIIKQDITFPPNLSISSEAKDFVLRILKKNPDERMRVSKLIEHPFLNKTVEVFELDI